jgi:hypothetical protein
MTIILLFFLGKHSMVGGEKVTITREQEVLIKCYICDCISSWTL